MFLEDGSICAFFFGYHCYKIKVLFTHEQYMRKSEFDQAALLVAVSS